MLYHKDVYMPELPLPKRPFGIWWTRHTQQACRDDRYGLIELPAGIDPRKKNVKVIEVLTDDSGAPVKVLYRMPYRDGLSLCLVVMLDGFMVRTAWLNETLDRHRTLNTAAYAQAVN